MTVNQSANRPEAGSLQQPPAPKLKISRLDCDPAMPLSHKATASPSTTAGGVTGTQRWNGEWSSDQLTRVEPPGEDKCTDQTGAVCPKFAEVRARQALAELQLTEFNHRSANVLQGLATRIDRQRRTSDDPAGRDELENLIAGVYAVARLHRLLLPSRAQTRVNLGTLLENLAIAIESITSLVCYVEAESVDVPSEVAVRLAAAVNELAWNAHKHAYSGAKGGKIRITCRREADGRLRLSVADQGCGLPPDFDPSVSEGLGFMVVCATTSQFGGELHVQSGGGTRFTLLLDISHV